MTELIFGSGKHRDRDQGVDLEGDRDLSQTTRGLGASGRIWAGRQCDAANGQMFDRGFVRPSAGDVIGATRDSGERSHARRRAPQDWDSGLGNRLDAVPGGPQMALGECSRGKQQWLFNHSAVVLPGLSGGNPAWISPLKSTARAVSRHRISDNCFRRVCVLTARARMVVAARVEVIANANLAAAPCHD
jgi:hypothetical protein